MGSLTHCFLHLPSYTLSSGHRSVRPHLVCSIPQIPCNAEVCLQPLRGFPFWWPGCGRNQSICRVIHAACAWAVVARSCQEDVKNVLGKFSLQLGKLVRLRNISWVWGCLGPDNHYSSVVPERDSGERPPAPSPLQWPLSGPTLCQVS